MPEPQTLMTGLMFGESPRWHNGRLWVSDWGTKEIIAIDSDGKSEMIVHLNFPSFQAICMDWLPDGRLLVVSSGDNKLLCKESDGALKTYADLSGLPGTGWNEIIVDGRGNAYVNGGAFSSIAGERFAPGIIGLVTSDGSVRQVADGIAFPNGMAVMPDNSTLIVAESHGKKLTAFDIGVDGGLSNRQVWADLGDDAPDGICIDSEGAIWYADVPHKHCVRVRKGGEVLQTVDLDLGCFACVLGGVDRKTLFIVAREWLGWESTNDGTRMGQVLTIQAPVAGAGWP